MLGEMKLIGGMLKESDRFPAPYGFSRRVMAGVEAIGRRRRGRLVPAFVWAAESVLVLLVLVIGAAAGLIASSAVRQEPRGPSWVLDVFDPVPQDSFGAIYLSAAEAGYEK